MAVQLSVESREFGWVERGHVVERGMPARASLAFALPAGHRQRDATTRREHRERRNEVGSEVETAVVGQRQYARAVLGRKCALYLPLGSASIDQALYEGPFAFRLGRLRKSERYAADRAHDLVLDIRQGRPRPSHAGSSSSGDTLRMRNSSSTGPRRSAAIRPLRSSTIVSG